MQSFLILMRGRSPDSATMVAATANPHLIREFADRVLDAPNDPLTTPGGADDEIEEAVAEGRRDALELVRDEASGKEAGDDEE